MPQRARRRIVLDMAGVYQMAIRLRAAKERKTISKVVIDAIIKNYPDEVEEAYKVLAQRL